MFTGIVESVGTVSKLVKEGSNIHITINSNISSESYIDQSISHDGICLTVVKKSKDTHTVTAVNETIQKTNLEQLKIGQRINLERAVIANSRMDGHMVQGHIDGTSICQNIQEVDGSWIFEFSLEEENKHLVVSKGSICINGVSLTVIDPKHSSFAVTIIPYTFEHTSFKTLKIGDTVNIEFDILGKYISRYLSRFSISNP